MSDTFHCEDKETLIGYLYGEIDAPDRRKVDAHLRTCTACTRELDGLRGVRLDLESWMPPEVALDFTIVPKPATVTRPARWSWTPLPAWAQVAAAALVLAASAAIANLQIRYDAAGLVVTTGWMAPVPAAAQPPAAADAWRQAIAALESKMNGELQTVKQTMADAPRIVETQTRVPASNLDSAGVLRRVQTLVSDSERRQQQEFAYRLTQFAREIEAQRRTDLMRINQDLRSTAGRTVMVEGNQRDMMNLLRRVSAPQP